MGALFSVVLLILSLPPFGVSYIAFISLIPFFYLSREKSIRQITAEACAIGFAIGLYSYFGALFENPWLYLTCAAVVVATYAAIGALSAVFIANSRDFPWIKLALIWALPEFLFDLIKLPFSYTTSLHNQLEILQMAAYVGAPGLALLLMAVQTGFVAIVVSKSKGNRLIGILAPSLGLCIAVFGLFGIGQAIEGETLKDSVAVDNVVAVQTAFEQEALDLVGLPGKIERIDREIGLLTDEIGQLPQDMLIVWPESVMPGIPVQIENDIIKHIYALNRRQIFHAYGVDSAGRTESSGWVVDQMGNRVGEYRKSLPVPFVEEYRKPDTFPVPIKIGNKRIGVLICSDSAFHDNFKKLHAGGADYVAVLTNDAYAGPSVLATIHLHLEQIHAIETGLSVVRSANGGPSAIIGNTGRLKESLDMFKTGFVTGEVERKNNPTFYLRFGTYLIICYWLALGAIGLRSFNGSKRHPERAKIRPLFAWSLLASHIALTSLAVAAQYGFVKGLYEGSVLRNVADVGGKQKVTVKDFVSRELGFVVSSEHSIGVGRKTRLDMLTEKGLVKQSYKQPNAKKYKHAYGIVSTRMGQLVLLQDNGESLLVYSEESGRLHKLTFDIFRKAVSGPITWIGVTVKNSDKLTL